MTNKIKIILIIALVVLSFLGGMYLTAPDEKADTLEHDNLIDELQIKSDSLQTAGEIFKDSISLKELELEAVLDGTLVIKQGYDKALDSHNKIIYDEKNNVNKDTVTINSSWISLKDSISDFLYR